jgi:hypothetical protein
VKKTPTLRIDSVRPYPERLLQRWKDGHYDVLDDRRISRFIRDILQHKAFRRRESRLRKGRNGDRRFFGEAYVASQIEHDTGWYGSFKWLTSPLCITERKASGEYSQEFWAALRGYFQDCLPDVHERASRLYNLPDFRKPVPPDLWLVVGRTHQFIEVKLKGDHVRNSQIAGLAVITSCLCGVVPVSVGVVRAYSDSEMKRVRRQQEDIEDQHMRDTFNRFCRLLSGS